MVPSLRPRPPREPARRPSVLRARCDRAEPDALCRRCVPVCADGGRLCGHRRDRAVRATRRERIAPPAALRLPAACSSARPLWLSCGVRLPLDSPHSLASHARIGLCRAQHDTTDGLGVHSGPRTADATLPGRRLLGEGRVGQCRVGRALRHDGTAATAMVIHRTVPLSIVRYLYGKAVPARCAWFPNRSSSETMKLAHTRARHVARAAPPSLPALLPGAHSRAPAAVDLQ